MTSGVSFIANFKRQKAVSNPIASDICLFRDAKGRKRKARIDVGKPQAIPGDRNDDWFCPVFIEGWTPHVIPAMGIGPVDALMNAVTLVRSFHEYIASPQITYGTLKKKV